VLTFAINYSQFKCAHLYENIIIVEFFRISSVAPHADCESDSVRR